MEFIHTPADLLKNTANLDIQTMATEVTKPTITYFNNPGRAEVARLILEDAGVDYEFRSATYDTWPELKKKLMSAG